MTEPRRRLAAIMFTDMVGYTALTQADEAHAMAVLARHNDLLRPLFSRFHGREVKAIGDSFLVEFESALEAVGCATEIQRVVGEHNESSEGSWRFKVRIGIHLGDVLESGADVLGDAVNIASRIEPLAEPGGICVSEPVYAQVRNKVNVGFARLPPSELKNVQDRIDVYRVDGVSGPATSSTRTDAGVGTHRLAVLPFTNMSPDPQDEFFADGLTEEMITELARVPGCQVIARTSVMRYKSAPKGIKEVGRELRVDFALEGSVRKAANRIRVTAQLIDARSEAHLWADRFDRELKDVFDLQTEIATKVADALKVELQPHDRAALKKTTTRSVEALELYLKGRQLWWLGGEPNYRTAVLHFQRAIELDPKFALAYCGLADSHALLGNQGYAPLGEALEAAEAAARKALELDPDLADAHISLAPVLYNRYDWAGAASLLRRAVSLDPNSVLGHFWLANTLVVRGRTEEALRESRTAASLDPLSRQAVLGPGSYLYAHRDFEGAIEYLLEVKSRLGFTSDNYQGLCELALGQTDLALTHLRAAATGPYANAPLRQANLAIACARAGRKDESDTILQRLVQEAHTGKAPAGPVALVYAAGGQADLAFEWFDRVYAERSSMVIEDVVWDPLIDPLRSDPRFPGLLKRFNLS